MQQTSGHLDQASQAQVIDRGGNPDEIYLRFLTAQIPDGSIPQEFADAKYCSAFKAWVAECQSILPASLFELPDFQDLKQEWGFREKQEHHPKIGKDQAAGGLTEITTRAWQKCLAQIHRQKETGTYFTPPAIAAVMASLLDPKAEREIADPACGTGILLVMYLRRFPPAEQHQVLEHLHGWDINPWSVAITRINLLLETCVDLPKQGILHIWEVLKQNIVTKDSLDDLSSPRKFNGLILNPPFLRIELLKKRREIVSRLCLVHRRWDSYLLFIELALNLLRPGGQVSCIVPDKVLTESNGQVLRTKLLGDRLLQKVVDCRAIETFEEAANVHPVILYLQTGSHTGMVEVLDPIPENGSKLKLILRSAIPTHHFQVLPSARIDLRLTPERDQIITKILAQSFPLKEVAYVSYGVQPGTKGRFVRPSGGKNPTEDGEKWLLRGRDVKKYAILPPQYLLRYDPATLHRPAFPQLFQSPRVVVPKVTGKCGIIAGIVPAGVEYYTDDAIVNIISLDRLVDLPPEFQKHRGLKFTVGTPCEVPVGMRWWEQNVKTYTRGATINRSMTNFYRQFSPPVLCALLNSKVVAFFYQMVLAGGTNVFPEHVRWVPITARLVNYATVLEKAVVGANSVNEAEIDETVFAAYGFGAGEIRVVEEYLSEI